MFVDTSRAGRRRYCVPEVCGNRINVAAHRARRRAAG
jgi:predicted RNA-binding Zn ribbon-like protein